tara:strand:+ start:1837 stop:2196 length:360 start_codon:yes stop_codon:yes gene_type:complete
MSIRWDEFNPAVVNSDTNNALNVCNELLRITTTPDMTCGEFIRILHDESTRSEQLWAKYMLEATAFIYARKLARRHNRVDVAAELTVLMRETWELFVNELNNLPDSRPASPTSIVMLEL